MLTDPGVKDEPGCFSLLTELRIIKDLGGEVLGPRPAIDRVGDCGAKHLAIVANVVPRNRHVSDLLLLGDGCTSPIDAVTLDQHDASRVNMQLAYLEEPSPFIDVWSVDQMAREDRDIKPVDEPERRDVSENGVCTLNVAQHRRRVVDPDDAVTEGQQRMRDPANTATQFEDRRSRGYRSMYQFGRITDRQAQVHGDGTAVARYLIHCRRTLLSGG
jgi:hypothetical protein